MKRKILVVDDNVNTLRVVGAILQGEGYEVYKARNGQEAIDTFEKQRDIDVVLADLKMPGMDGLELYGKMSAVEVDIPYVIMTAYGTIESAVEAMKEGVTNYLIKPLNYAELSIVLEKAIREKKISSELAELRREAREKDYFQEIIGTDSKMKEVFEVIRTSAPTDVPILIRGETGTGKELLAKAIHSLSRRHDHPMICINSAALTDSLLEAELFGHVKGAFTGAISNKKGRLEAANKGTLFLDEIGHMSLNLQSKLLRFLQEGSFEPVGGVEARNVDVRVITATNRDLREEISAGRFLSDLLYRIEVISITLPPLRERGDDIILLVNHFINQFSKTYGKEIDHIHPAAMDAMARYHWSGNVRELENCIARAIILCKGRSIGIEDLPDRIRNNGDPSRDHRTAKEVLTLPEEGISIKELERLLIRMTLEKCNGNKSLAANYLGISRKALYEKMDRYEIPV
jgi:DNA-binding NtrC family response regulator